MKTIVFTAPQGWGKTITATELAKQHGCAMIVDEFNPDNDLLIPGALHMTNVPPDEIDLPGCEYSLVQQGWS